MTPDQAQVKLRRVKEQLAHELDAAIAAERFGRLGEANEHREVAARLLAASRKLEQYVREQPRLF